MNDTQKLRQDADQGDGDVQDSLRKIDDSWIFHPDRYQEDTLSRAQAVLLVVWAAILAAACVLGALMN